MSSLSCFSGYRYALLWLSSCSGVISRQFFLWRGRAYSSARGYLRHHRVNLVCNNMQAGVVCQVAYIMNSRTQGFPADHCIVTRWSMSFTSLIEGFGWWERWGFICTRRSHLWNWLPAVSLQPVICLSLHSTSPTKTNSCYVCIHWYGFWPLHSIFWRFLSLLGRSPCCLTYQLVVSCVWETGYAAWKRLSFFFSMSEKQS